MRACNGNKLRTPSEEAIEITRLEPVILEVARGDDVSSHLILFEIICKIKFTQEEMKVTGDIKETVFEVEEKEF